MKKLAKIFNQEWFIETFNSFLLLNFQYGKIHYNENMYYDGEIHYGGEDQFNVLEV